MFTEIRLQQGDITKLSIGAIVNAANSSLLGGGGVDGAIHRAGGPAILEACKKIRNEQGKCKTGEAVVTTAGNLSADYVIHTVGPVWNGGSENEAALLVNCYRNSLRIAAQHGVKSIAFPNISTGVYGYPKKKAAEVALCAIKAFIETDQRLDLIIIICYDEENYSIYQELLQVQ